MKTRNNPFLKKMDFYIGIPMLFSLGLFHKKQQKKQEIQRIAIIKTAGIGDVVLMSACIREIKANISSCEIVFIATEATQSVAPSLAGVDATYVFAMKHPLKGFAGLRALGHFDCAVDFGSWPRIDAMIAYALRADYRVGFYRKNMHRHYAYDIFVVHRDDVHELENYRHLVAALGMKIHGFQPQIRVDEKRILSERYIVFHMYPGGSLARLKKWPMEKWMSLAKQVDEKYGCKIVLTGSVDDQEAAQAFCGHLRKEHKVEAKSLAGKLKLQETIGLLQGAMAVISVDTGVLHLAAAVGVPTIGLMGPTAAWRWGPLGSKVQVVESGILCRPCISLGFDSKCQHARCMEQIEVKTVLALLDNIM